MHHKGARFVRAIIMFVAVAFIAACEQSDNGNTSAQIPAKPVQAGVLKIRMHDLPINGADIEKVLIGITGVEVHDSAKGWLSIPFEPKIYDLLELQNGISVLIFSNTLEVGHYTQIRLNVSKINEVYIGGNTYPLTVPSGEETGVKLITPFDIEEGKIVEVTLDFNAESSVKGDIEKGFSLTPVIKIDSVAEYDGAGVVTYDDGGGVSTIDGNLNIIVPPKTTSGNVVVSIDEFDPNTLAGTLPDGMVFVGKAYKLQPEGYTFYNNVTLEFAYNELEVTKIGAEENLSIVTFNEQLATWELVPTTVLSSSNIVQAQVSHFSAWAVAEPTYNPCDPLSSDTLQPGVTYAFTAYCSTPMTSPTWHFCNSYGSGGWWWDAQDCTIVSASYVGISSSGKYSYRAPHTFYCDSGTCNRYLQFDAVDPSNIKYYRYAKLTVGTGSSGSNYDIWDSINDGATDAANYAGDALNDFGDSIADTFGW